MLSTEALGTGDAAKLKDPFFGEACLSVRLQDFQPVLLEMDQSFGPAVPSPSGIDELALPLLAPHSEYLLE